MPRNGLPSEYKSSPAITLATDETKGLVEHVVALTGNLDLGRDRIMRGAFTKTVAERGHKVRVLDHHNTGSITHVLGRPLEIREVGREELPPAVLAAHPQVTGGLRVTTQFALETEKGRTAFDLIKGGYVDEYSIGFDPLDVEYTHEMLDGRRTTIRNIKAVRLWEYSPVLWGMNEATTTISAKDAHGAAEATEEGNVNAFKAADFATAFEQRQTERALSDLRWDMEQAFFRSLDSIMEDENLDGAGKIVAAEESALQYGQALAAWAKAVVQARIDAGEGAEKALAPLGRPETKYGRRISKETRSVLEAALTAINSLLAEDLETEAAPSEGDGCTRKPETKLASPEATAGPTETQSPTALAAELLALEATLNLLCVEV